MSTFERDSLAAIPTMTVPIVAGIENRFFDTVTDTHFWQPKFANVATENSVISGVSRASVSGACPDTLYRFPSVRMQRFGITKLWHVISF